VCNSDSKCSPNQICENRLCVGGCHSDTSCPDNEACIDKQCRGKSYGYSIDYRVVMFKNFFYNLLIIKI